MRELIPFANKAKEQGIKIYHVNIGQPDIASPKQFFKELHKYKKDYVPYAPSAGIPEFNDVVADYLNTFKVNISGTNIIPTIGGSEAIVFSLAALCDERDEVLVFEPFYANYKAFAGLLNIKLVGIPTNAEDGYQIPSQKTIKKYITKKTKAILFCSPNNPTGTVHPRQSFKELHAICEKHDLHLISDEVYREFIYSKDKPFTALQLQDKNNRVVVIDSMSKRFSLCGSRLGFIASKNKEFMQTILRLAQLRLSAPTLPQIACVPLIKNQAKHHKNLMSQYTKRRAVVLNALQKIDGCTCVQPQGSLYAFAKLPIKNSVDFAKWLLTDFRDKKETVMVASGKGFYLDPKKGADEIRIAYVLNERDMKRAMELLVDGVHEYTSARVNK